MIETTPPAYGAPTEARLYDPGDVVEAEIGELQVMRSPMFERATAHVGRDIVLCLPGGATYGGTLDDVGDDGVLTVRDGDDVYEIDVEHVAVIESQRQR